MKLDVRILQLLAFGTLIPQDQDKEPSRRERRKPFRAGDMVVVAPVATYMREEQVEFVDYVGSGMVAVKDADGQQSIIRADRIRLAQEVNCG